MIDGGVRTVALRRAHAAGSATTQMLRVLGDDPNVRLLFTLVDATAGSSPGGRRASRGSPIPPRSRF